ncbi:hypothetical protein DID88_010178 [Monilinia fructigena]|uniref:Uncharacterized protein n=1 Tax=Monilinia fructigena TaxID=38457 RepID=A0A395IN85_9HELO|nr:hypothetical protein DID88_010178 [Monilinia fructigena]
MSEKSALVYEPRSDTIAQGVFDPNLVVNNSTTVSTATVEDNNNNPNTESNKSYPRSRYIDSKQNDDSLDIDDLFGDSLSAEVKLPQVDEPKSTECQHKSDGVASNLEQNKGDNTDFDSDLNAAFDTEFALPVKSDILPNFEDALDAEMAAELETELEAELGSWISTRYGKPDSSRGWILALDEDEDEDDESLESVDEELNPQSQDAGSKIIIDLNGDDYDEGVQDDPLPSKSLQNIQPQENITEN